jgi:hypothetical protein
VNVAFLAHTFPCRFLGHDSKVKVVIAWYFFSHYPSLSTSESLPYGCHNFYNFFSTGHGKGEVDGFGALLKRELKKKQIELHG